MKKEITRQVAKALTAREKDDDDDGEEVPMKREDGHQMRRPQRRSPGRIDPRRLVYLIVRNQVKVVLNIFR